jgi:hypothetical protein
LSYSVDVAGKLGLEQVIALHGNALDVAVLADQQSIIVSLDTAHIPNSTMILKSTQESESKQFFRSFKLEVSNTSSQWAETDLLNGLTGKSAELRDLPSIPDAIPEAQKGRSDRKGPYSPLGNFLYGLENLRKKRDFADPDADEEDGEEPLPASELPPEVSKTSV